MNISAETLRQRAVRCHLEIPYHIKNGDVIIGHARTPPGVEIARKKQEMPVPYEEIEPEEPSRNQIMRSLVRTMNDIPFLATIACCQGHNKDYEGTRRLDPGVQYMWGGWLAFAFDPRMPACEQFFDRLELLLRQNPFVKIDFDTVENNDIYIVDPPSNERYGLPSCCVAFDLRHGAIMPREKAEQTVKLYDQFWLQLDTLAESFKAI